MVTNKLKTSLSDYLELHHSEYITVVITLNHDTNTGASQLLSKADKINYMKRQFNDSIVPVVSFIEGNAGNVIDSAWINHTLKVKLPAHSIKELTSREDVRAIEFAQHLSKE